MWATQQERYHLDGLYHPFMVILEMVYYSVHHIIPGDLMVILWLKNVCYWKWPFIVDLPIKNGDFHSYVSLPEGMG